MWPFARKRALMAFRFRMEFHLEAVWKKFAFIRTTSVIRSKKICIHLNGLITRSVEMSSHWNNLLTRLLKTSNLSNNLLTSLVKTSIRSNELLTHSIKTSNRLNDLLTHLLKTFNCLNDLLTHPSVQTTWENHWMALIICSGKKYQGIRAVVSTCSRTHVFMSCTRKKSLQSLEQSASRLRDNHKTSPNNEAYKETVHVEKSNYGVVSLGSNGFCFWMAIQKCCFCFLELFLHDLWVKTTFVQSSHWTAVCVNKWELRCCKFL